MTGHAFRGDEPRWTHAPREHGAIHFHDDDLEDCGWEEGFALTVPDDLPSGVYAARLTAADFVDHLPFFVRPRGRRASSPILWVVPTNSYLAYANYHSLVDQEEKDTWNVKVDFPVTEQDKYMVDEQLLSCYDHHSDGSGVCYSSWLRPIVSVRPAMLEWILGEGRGYPHQLSADLHLVDWLTQKGFQFDVATDEDLHREGVELLAQYRVVLSGSHHEYWSGEMLDALEAYQQRGGRFMYLAGNGLYWITSYAPGRPHAVEIRRWGGTQAWRAAPGENYHSTTGELGGLWRNRARAPQRYVGVGFTSQGFDVSLPYTRQPGSFDPRASWIFEGIGAEEPIGGFGLVMGGACGFEVDRTDAALGTPPHALILASATGFSDSYQHVVEEVDQSTSRQGGTVNPLVRGEMVFYETPNGGAVFSVGSISYCGSLSHDNYANNVSRLTENVLRRFLDPAPFA
jgi:N,N-dimethylformamidase